MGWDGTKKLTDAQVYNIMRPYVTSLLDRVVDLMSLQYRLQKHLGFGVQADFTKLPWSYVEYLLSDLD